MEIDRSGPDVDPKRLQKKKQRQRCSERPSAVFFSTKKTPLRSPAETHAYISTALRPLLRNLQLRRWIIRFHQHLREARQLIGSAYLLREHGNLDDVEVLI